MSSERIHRLEAQMTETTVRYLWPTLRRLWARSLSRRCSRCVLSERAVEIGARGICARCERDASSAVNARAQVPREALDGRLAERGRGQVDALVLLSGGKDSAYMLERLGRDYPELRTIALLVDNGFMSPVARENAQDVARRLDVPIVQWRLSKRVVRHALRYALMHLDRQTGYSVVDLMDGCLTFDTAMKIALSHGIPSVLCGLGTVQLDQVFGRAPLELTPAEYRAPLEEQLGLPLQNVLEPRDRGFWFDGGGASGSPRFILPFSCWDPTEEEVLRSVTRSGLLQASRSSPLVTNNALIPVIGMAEVARYGYCGWEVEFADMVRQGRSERSYWLHMFEMLEYATRTGRFVNKTVEQTLASLDLDKAALGIGRAGMARSEPTMGTVA